MSIGELQRRRNRLLAAIEQFEEQLCAPSTPAASLAEIPQRIAQLQQQVDNLDKQIEDSLPQSSSGGDSFLPPAVYNDFRGANLGSTNFGDSPTGNFTGTQQNRLPASRQANQQLPGSSSWAYLLFSVFDSFNYQGDRVQLSVELHFLSPETGEIQTQPIPLNGIGEDSDGSDTDEETYDLKQLPQYLEQALISSVQLLRKLPRPRGRRIAYIPVVNLFLPMQLLAEPLQRWCCTPPDLPWKYPVVVRSADRFQGSPLDASYYLDNLDKVWQRFFQVSEGGSPRLSKLKWLSSSDANTLSAVGQQPNDYVGIQCLGHWLKPDSKDWQTLIESGFPLAFWLCECDVPSHIRRHVFHLLTQGDRFALLESLTRIRRQLGDTQLGVFYEDLDYTPTTGPFLNWAS